MFLRNAAKLFLLLAFVACSMPARAVDFKTRGLWQFGFGIGVNSLADKASGKSLDSPISNDKF